MKTREIKFRVWDNGAMKRFIRIPFYVDCDGNTYKDNDPHGVDMSGKRSISPLINCVLMQYTGLKDKRGKEIYEGDVVELFWPFAGATYRCKVFWLTERGCWAMARDEGKATYNGIFHYFGDQDTNLMDIEVIGNIYEGI